MPGEHVRRQGAAASTTCAEATALARRHGLATHLDGARLFNAAVALAQRRSARDARADRGALFDSVSVCFSKGLGAPVGSALVGSRDLSRARTACARCSAAACARPACWPPRRCTRSTTTSTASPTTTRMRARLAEGLRGPRWRTVERAASTNMVFVDLAPGGARQDTVARLRERGVLCTGLYQLRLVTHLDVDAADIDRAVRILRETL